MVHNQVNNLDPYELGFYGGEEYELVVAVNPRRFRKAERAVAEQGGILYKIGKATVGNELLVQQKSTLVRLEERGYEHFMLEG